jgi:hypothetical protein
MSRKFHFLKFSSKHEKCMVYSSNTTSLVSPGAEGLDLPGVEKPEDEILEQPGQHLSMHRSHTLATTPR